MILPAHPVLEARVTEAWGLDIGFPARFWTPWEQGTRDSGESEVCG
jgi:hypothetical protein